MRSRSLIALAAAGAVALPLISNATGDDIQHRLAFVPHNTIPTTAYPQNQIEIDEFGGPVNPYIWEQPLLNPNPWGPREIASVPVPAPAPIQYSAVVTQSAPGAMSSAGSSVTWYFPDGTVAHQQFPGSAPMSSSEPSASSGSSHHR